MFEDDIIDITEIKKLPKELEELGKMIYKNNHIIELSNIETKEIEIKLIVKDRITMGLVNKANNLNMKFLGKTRTDYSLYILECGHFKEIKKVNFRNESFECKECINDTWKLEAKNSNLEYILYGDSNKSVYKFLSGDKCNKGHIQVIGRKEVKNKHFKCEKCYNDGLKEVALKKNMEFIDVVKEHYAVYKLDCGHYKMKNFGNLKKEMDNGKIEECDVCKIEMLEKKSDDRGFKLLNRSSGKSNDITIMCKDCNSIDIIKENKLDKQVCSNCQEISESNDIDTLGLKFIKRIDRYKKLYKIKKCNHYQIIQNAQILRKRELLRNGIDTTFDCTKCREIELDKKLSKESEEAGVKFLVKIDKDHALYEILDCGHKQSIGIKEIRRKSFKCKTCKAIYLSNGIEVKSNYEKIVGNYLIIKNYMYEYEKSISDKTNHKCDFYINCNNDLYIEIAGYLKNKDDKGDNKIAKKYYKGLQDKINKCYEDKKLLILYQEDFIGDLWREKMDEIIG